MYTRLNTNYNNYEGDIMENKMVFNAEETAKFLGVGMNKIYELLTSGQIPSRRIGRKYLIPRLALENWLNVSVLKEGVKNEGMYQQGRK